MLLLNWDQIFITRFETPISCKMHDGSQQVTDGKHFSYSKSQHKKYSVN